MEKTKIIGIERVEIQNCILVKINGIKDLQVFRTNVMKVRGKVRFKVHKIR